VGVLRFGESPRSFTRIALPAKMSSHDSAFIGLPQGPRADRTA
jgi:hypothetical protein